MSDQTNVLLMGNNTDTLWHPLKPAEQELKGMGKYLILNDTS
jgi:hypothetical protein